MANVAGSIPARPTPPPLAASAPPGRWRRGHDAGQVCSAGDGPLVRPHLAAKRL